MMFIKIYLMIALPVVAAVFLVYVNLKVKKRIQNLKNKESYHLQEDSIDKGKSSDLSSKRHRVKGGGNSV